MAASISLSQIRDLMGLPGEGEGDSGVVFSRVSGLDDAGPEAVVFAQDETALAKALVSGAGLILGPLAANGGRVAGVKNPKYAFAVVGRWLEGDGEGVIHTSATVGAEAQVAEGTSVGAGAVIENGAVVGKHCSIGSNVTVYGCVRIGERVLVQSGAVLGAMGFGYVRGEDDCYVRFPQQGTLVIENEVEIGANTTIDRGALGETRIGSGTKIDNQVHIGHNCLIGKNVIIAAQVGISGSCVVGDGVVMAGQVGLGDHVTVGPGVILGGASGVFPGKTLEGNGQMFMGVPALPLKDYLKSTARLRRLK
jgi:UDP-3-O-[3-hydroxymyristoyl] glucosamine N-acyltransferase